MQSYKTDIEDLKIIFYELKQFFGIDSILESKKTEMEELEDFLDEGAPVSHIVYGELSIHTRGAFVEDEALERVAAKRVLEIQISKLVRRKDYYSKLFAPLSLADIDLIYHFYKNDLDPTADQRILKALDTFNQHKIKVYKQYQEDQGRKRRYEAKKKVDRFLQPEFKEKRAKIKIPFTPKR